MRPESETAGMERESFGVRWQSAAATPLFGPGSRNRRGASLPPQSNRFQRVAFSRLDFLAVLAIVLAAVGLLLLFVLRSATVSSVVSCQTQLSDIASALTRYDIEMRSSFSENIEKKYGNGGNGRPNIAAADFYRELIDIKYIGAHSLVCPSDVRNEAIDSLSDSNISYFLVISAGYEPDAALVGDRNIGQFSVTTVKISDPTLLYWNSQSGLHVTNGNIAFRDGHVARVGTANLPQIFLRNRESVKIAFP